MTRSDRSPAYVAQSAHAPHWNRTVSRYTAELDEADRQFCYVSKAVKVDAQCLQRLYTSDRTYRELLRNQVLTGLQDVESEAGYLAQCAQASSASSGASSPLSDGVVCLPDLSDTTEIQSLLVSTLASLDSLFASVTPAEMKAGMERVGKSG